MKTILLSGISMLGLFAFGQNLHRSFPIPYNPDNPYSFGNTAPMVATSDGGYLLHFYFARLRQPKNRKPLGSSYLTKTRLFLRE